MLRSQIKKSVSENGNMLSQVGLKVGKKHLLDAFDFFSIEKNPASIMLGLKKLLIKIHGGADSLEVTNGLIQAYNYVKANIKHDIIEGTKKDLTRFRKSVKEKTTED